MKQITTLLIILTLTVINSCRQNQDNEKSLKKITVSTKTIKSNEIKNQQRHYFDTIFC